MNSLPASEVTMSAQKELYTFQAVSDNRYVLTSSDNLIDAGNDFTVMLTYLMRFKRTNIALLDFEAHREYFIENGFLKSKRA